jgi:hypothetical protein
VSSVSRPGAHPCVLLVCWVGLLTVAQQRWDGRQHALAQQSQGSKVGSHRLHLHQTTEEASTIKNTSLMLWGFKWNPRAPCKRPQYAPQCLARHYRRKSRQSTEPPLVRHLIFLKSRTTLQEPKTRTFPGFILIKRLCQQQVQSQVSLATKPSQHDSKLSSRFLILE